MEILLRHMLEEMKLRAALDSNHNGNHINSGVGAGSSIFPVQVPHINQQQLRQLRLKQEEMTDIETNCLHAKAIRACICVRVVNTKTVESTVGYIIRVEDIESGLIWLVHKRYSDFFALHKEIMSNILSSNNSSENSGSDLYANSNAYTPPHIRAQASSSSVNMGRGVDASTQVQSHIQSPLAKQYKEQAVFPNKRLALHIRHDRLIDQRVCGLEQYLRQAMHVCLANVSVDLNAARALRRIQTFLNVDKHIDCIHPPYIDDQHVLERIAYVAMTDPDNVACQQINNFLGNWKSYPLAYDLYNFRSQRI
jgi:hypothetical protein